MSRFEDRLLAEIVELHGAALAEGPGVALPSSPAVRRPRLSFGTRGLIPAGAGALALTAAIVALMLGLGSDGNGGAAPAYAVVTNRDGTVTVTVRELAGVTGADEALRTLGIRAHVVRATLQCPTTSGQYRSPQLTPEQSQAIARSSVEGGVPVMVIDPSAIPAGDSVVIGARSLPTTGSSLEAIGLEAIVYEGATPSCLPAAGSG